MSKKQSNPPPPKNTKRPDPPTPPPICSYEFGHNRSSFVIRDEFINTIIEQRLRQDCVVDETEMAAIVEYIEKLESKIKNTPEVEPDETEQVNRCYRHVNRPEIICLCGSTKFKTDFERMNKEFTMEGKIVLSVGFFGHVDGGLIDEVKKKLDQLHFRKIDLADKVFIINKDGYIGESTKNEIIYAQKIGKDIDYMEWVFDDETGIEEPKWNTPIN